MLHFPVRGSETDTLADERSDETSPIDDVLGHSGAGGKRVQHFFSIDFVALLLRREGLGSDLFPRVIQLPQRNERRRAGRAKMSSL